MALIEPGRSFREITEAAWTIPAPYYARRYFVMIHGIGATGEYPYMIYEADYDGGQDYDGVVEPNMTLCVESFIGHEEGGEGVKLEEQVLVTETWDRADEHVPVGREAARLRGLRNWCRITRSSTSLLIERASFKSTQYRISCTPVNKPILL